MHEEALANLDNVLQYLDRQNLHLAAAHVSMAIEILSQNADDSAFINNPVEIHPPK